VHLKSAKRQKISIHSSDIFLSTSITRKKIHPANTLNKIEQCGKRTMILLMPWIRSCSSTNLSAARDAIMPINEEWFFRMPFDNDFSAISGASSVFEKLAVYICRENERGISPGSASLVYSSSENATTSEFDTASRKVELSLRFHASEHGFLAAEFRCLAHPSPFL
jgi:hypothetical protein